MIRLPRWVLALLVLTLFLGLAAPALAGDLKGKIKSVDADKNEFVLTDNNDKDVTITLDKDGKVFINDKESKLSDLKAGDKAEVTCEKKEDKHIASKVKVTRD